MNQQYMKLAAEDNDVESARVAAERRGIRIVPGVRQDAERRYYQIGQLGNEQFQIPYDSGSTYEIVGDSFIAENGSERLIKVYRIDRPGMMIASCKGKPLCTIEPSPGRVRIA
jgi:hypothetical protein